MQARPQGSPSFWLEEKRGRGPRKLRDQTAPAPAASCPLGPRSALALPPRLVLHSSLLHQRAPSTSH